MSERVAIYDQLYPYYVEICALSQIRPLDSPFGGRAGHAVLYLKGVRREKDSPIPLLALSDENSPDIHSEESGVGISVDKMFRNVNWVAIPGKRLLLHGNLPGGVSLTEERRRAAVRTALDLHLFRGIELHDEYLGDKTAAQGLEEYVASQTIGTDYALKFGRTIYSGRLPVTRPMLEKMVAYLNLLNQRYASDEAGFNWSGYYDNCVHTIHNALAAAGIWKRKPVSAIKLLQLMNLAIPANEFIALARLANDFPLEMFSRIYFDRTMRENLMKRGWLPTRHGSLLETIPVHPDNRLYNTDFKMLILEPGLILSRNHRRARKMLSEARYTDLRENLEFFKARYESILKKMRGGQEEQAGEMRYQIAHRRYLSYIREQLEDAGTKLRRLRELEQGRV